eukprot:scaffold2193_cov179-Ochromonas_danica.AAC.34
MSMYEHLNHKAYGFETAHNKSIILASHAAQSECEALNNKQTRTRQKYYPSNYLALIPFYGGLPPNVTKDLSVKSIGQGNSLVDASTKALQTLATTCSCLKYFGNVVIGVARLQDRILILDMLQRLSVRDRQHVNVVQFHLAKPSFLPFHLLAWGQYFMRYHNCHPFYKSNATSSSKTSAADFGFPVGEVDLERLPPGNKEEYEICYPNAITPYSGGPVQVVYMKKPADFISRASSIGFRHGNHSHVKEDGKNKATAIVDHLPVDRQLLRYAYYSECDQIVVFDDLVTLEALSKASNETTFFTGRRKEKQRDSDPRDYMGALNMWRECGTAGYSLSWPKSTFVYHDD